MRLRQRIIINLFTFGNSLLVINVKKSTGIPKFNNAQFNERKFKFIIAMINYKSTSSNLQIR